MRTIRRCFAATDDRLARPLHPVFPAILAGARVFHRQQATIILVREAMGWDELMFFSQRSLVDGIVQQSGADLAFVHHQVGVGWYTNRSSPWPRYIRTRTGILRSRPYRTRYAEQRQAQQVASAQKECLYGGFHHDGVVGNGLILRVSGSFGPQGQNSCSLLHRYDDSKITFPDREFILGQGGTWDRDVGRGLGRGTKREGRGTWDEGRGGTRTGTRAGGGDVGKAACLPAYALLPTACLLPAAYRPSPPCAIKSSNQPRTRFQRQSPRNRIRDRSDTPARVSFPPPGCPAPCVPTQGTPPVPGPQRINSSVAICETPAQAPSVHPDRQRIIQGQAVPFPTVSFTPCVYSIGTSGRRSSVAGCAGRGTTTGADCTGFRPRFSSVLSVFIAPAAGCCRSAGCTRVGAIDEKAGGFPVVVEA